MAFRPDEPEGPSEADMRDAREWLASFDVETIPKKLCDISFSRSSGPGGQNVNKVNSKATLRLPLNSLLPLLPGLLHQELVQSRFYAEKSNSLVIQADGNRKQSDNVLECFEKLRALILKIGKAVVQGELSPATKERIKALQKAGNEVRLTSKKTHSSKKSARKGGGRPDY